MQRHQFSIFGRLGTMFILLILSLIFGSANAFAQDTIKIGAVIPLSKAAFAQVGEEQRRGFLMALEEVNHAGGLLGKKVELIIEDDTGEPSVGIAGMEKLISRDKVVALIGGYSSTITFAQLNAIQRYEPLKAELQAFIKAIQQNSPVPVSGEDGLAALNLALCVVESGRTHRVIEISHEID